MKNKVVWITGASSGIGEALVYAYNRMGARLIISSRNRDELFRVKSNCVDQINVHVLSLDLALSDSLPEKAKDALRIYGSIDLLIHSGGISQRALAIDTDFATEQRLMTVNFWGTVLLTKAVLPSMMERNEGHIVCISSLVGKFGTPLRSAYAASKHALHGYMDSLRAETNKSIHFTLVCPGFIKTKVTLNALTANGSPQGTMDEAQANGMPPEVCANAIVKAVKNKKKEVYIGGKETYGVWLKRLFPGRFAGLIRKTKVT